MTIAPYTDFRLDHYRMPTLLALALRRVYVGRHFGRPLDVVAGMLEGVVSGLQLCASLAASDYASSDTSDVEADVAIRQTYTRAGVWRLWELLEALALSKHECKLTFLRTNFLAGDTHTLEWQRAAAWLIDRLDHPGMSRDKLDIGGARRLAVDMDEAFAAFVSGLGGLHHVTIFQVTDTRISHDRSFAVCLPYRGFLKQPPIALELEGTTNVPIPGTWYVCTDKSALAFPLMHVFVDRSPQNGTFSHPSPPQSAPAGDEAAYASQSLVLSEYSQQVLGSLTSSNPILLRRESTHDLSLQFDSDGAARFSVVLNDLGASSIHSLDLSGPKPPVGTLVAWVTSATTGKPPRLCYTFVSDSDISAAEILHLGGKLTSSLAARATANAAAGWTEQPPTKRTLEHLLIAPDGHAQWTPVRVADTTRAIDVNAGVPTQIFQCFQSLGGVSANSNSSEAQHRIPANPNAAEVYSVLAEFATPSSEADLGGELVFERLQTQLLPPLQQQIRAALEIPQFSERIQALRTLDRALWGEKPRFVVQLAIADEFARQGDIVSALEITRNLFASAPMDREVLNRLRLLARTKDDWQQVATGLVQQFESSTSKDDRRRTMEDLASLFSEKLADTRSAMVAVACAISEDPEHWEPKRLAAQLADHHACWDVLTEAVSDAGVDSYVAAEVLRQEAKLRNDVAILDIIDRIPKVNSQTPPQPQDLEPEPHLPDMKSVAPIRPDLELLLGESGNTVAVPLEYYIQIRPDASIASESSQQTPNEVDDQLVTTTAESEIPNVTTPTLAGIRQQILIAETDNRWSDAIAARRTLVDLLDDAESKAVILAELGDVALNRLNDADLAGLAYEEALSHHPESKAILGRLLELRLNQGRHAAAAKILKRFAELEDDLGRRASHLVALGILYRDYLNDLVIATEAMELALDLDPHRLETFAILDTIRSSQGALAQIQSYERMLRRLAGMDHQEEVVYKLLTNLAKLYRTAGQDDRSIKVWRKARAMRPDDQAVHRALGVLYESNDNTLGDAVAAYLDALSVGSFDPAIIRSLRRVFTRQKKTDAAWCACGVLIQLQAADDKEKTYYDSHIAGALKVSTTIRDTETWEKHLYSDNQNVDVGRLFEALFATVPSLFAAHSPSSFGTPAMQRVDLNQRSALTSFASTIPRVLGVNVPTFFHARLATGIMKVSASPAALLLGADVMEQTKGKRLRYMLGRAVALLHGPHLVAGLRPAEDLRDIAFALQLVVSGTASRMDYASNNIRRWAQILSQAIDGNARKALFALAPTVFRSPEPPDVDGWLRAIDLTASNAGLLLCNDIAIALECMEAEVHPLIQIPFKERSEVLMRYALSPRYHELRAMLGIAVA
ncbi:MAG: hypothetical protein HUU55_08350 [Myxococcales bacterium]|nr:hypothetical protein [Myxococcales bacterium]